MVFEWSWKFNRKITAKISYLNWRHVFSLIYIYKNSSTLKKTKKKLREKIEQQQQDFFVLFFIYPYGYTATHIHVYTHQGLCEHFFLYFMCSTVYVNIRQ